MTEEQATQQLIYLEQAVFLLQATAVSTAIGVGILTWLLVRISIKGLWD